MDVVQQFEKQVHDEIQNACIAMSKSFGGNNICLVNNNEEIDGQDVPDMRNIYLYMMDPSKGGNVNRTFDQFGKGLLSHGVRMIPSKINITIGNTTKLIDTPFAFGRETYNHEGIPSENKTISRIQFLVFTLESGGRQFIQVTDMWSVNGTSILARSDSGALHKSLPTSRKIFAFPLDTGVVFGIGQDEKLKIGINGDKVIEVCGICLDKPRSRRFGCGHAITCDECAEKVENCPLCRAHISNIMVSIPVRDYREL